MAQFEHFGYSAIANAAAAIAFARLRDIGPNDVVLTVATDGAAMYNSGREPIRQRDFGGTFGRAEAAATVERHLGDPGVHAVLDLDERERRRIFNLGYFTWVEQQNLDVDAFTARGEEAWWDAMVPTVELWDELITDFNQRTGLA